MPVTKDKKNRLTPRVKSKLPQVLTGTLEGKSMTQIAEEAGLERRTVAKLLSSSEAEKILERARSRSVILVDKSMDRLENVLDDPDDNNNAVKVALALLKSAGVVKDQVDVNHNLPEPFVVSYKDQRIEIGVNPAEFKKEDDEDSN